MAKSSSSSKTSSSSSSKTASTSKTTNTSKTIDKSKSTTTSSGTSATSSNSMSATVSSSRTAAVGEVDAATQAAYNKYNSQGYQQSDAVKTAYSQLQKSLANKPGAFSSGYEKALDNLYNQIANRGKFSYDFNKDAMYQAYKDNYMSQGKTAMKDTMGQAAAMTGGYGSSYSQAAGQQAYQNYLNELSNIIPTLRDQAYQEYIQEGNDLKDQFSLANSMYNRDYAKYRDTVSDYQSDRSFAQSAYSDERNYDRSAYNSDRDYTAQQYWNMKNAVQETNSTSLTNTTSNSLTNTSNKSTTNTSGTSSTNASSLTNALSNTLQNSMSTTNSNSFSSGSGGSGGSGSSGSTAAQSNVRYTANDVTNEMANIARRTKGSDTDRERISFLSTAVNNGYITPQEFEYYLDKFKL